MSNIDSLINTIQCKTLFSIFKTNILSTCLESVTCRSTFVVMLLWNKWSHSKFQNIPSLSISTFCMIPAILATLYRVLYKFVLLLPAPAQMYTSLFFMWVYQLPLEALLFILAMQIFIHHVSFSMIGLLSTCCFEFLKLMLTFKSVLFLSPLLNWHLLVGFFLGARIHIRHQAVDCLLKDVNVGLDIGSSPKPLWLLLKQWLLVLTVVFIFKYLC